MLCYCGSRRAFDICCMQFIAGHVVAENCEQLMRSRYSAYCHGKIDYIYQTYHPSMRTANPKHALSDFANNSHFTELNVLSAEQNAQEGFVSFNLKYIQGNVLYEFSERSRFIYSDAWYYIDGLVSEKPPLKLGRNDICPCRSGKKFKSCRIHQASGS